MDEQKWEIQDPNRKINISENPIPGIYPVIDTDLARDNVENDIPAADRNDL